MEKNKLPLSFWIVAVLAIIWNIFGLLSFFGHWLLPESMKNEMTAEELELYNSYPDWTYIVFAVATFSGLIGSILLILRKSLAKPVFLVSLIAVIIQFSHSLFFTNSIEVHGLIQTISFPIVIVLIGIFLLVYSKLAIKKRWIQ